MSKDSGLGVVGLGVIVFPGITGGGGFVVDTVPGILIGHTSE